MTEIHSTLSRSSRSPSVDTTPPPGRRRHRMITIIDGDFQSKVPISEKCTSSSPSPKTSPATTDQDTFNSVHSVEHFHKQAFTIPDRSSTNSDQRSNSPDADYLSTSQNHIGLLQAPLSPVLWRSSDSSTSSLADTMIGLVRKPSSEQNILRDIKQNMMHSFKNYKAISREAANVPKLKKDIEALQKEREKLMNELLDYSAVVLQLKQRVSLLHEQNLQLATLARNEPLNGNGGNTQVLAIRNTLVATLAQLKQMEGQVQSIPTLKNQIRELEYENEKLKSSESDLPEGVTASDYRSILDENARLSLANKELAQEMKIIHEHLKTISESCYGLQKRMEQFHSSHVSTRSLQEKVNRLELQKKSLCQKTKTSKVVPQTDMDIDTAHLYTEVTALKNANRILQNKLALKKAEARQQKERFLLKLFEIEALNVKTSKFELEKKMLELEHSHLLQSNRVLSQSPPLSPGLGSTDTLDDDDIVDIPPEAKAQLLRFRQLEVHIQESQTHLTAFLSEKVELEGRLTELTNQLEEKEVTELQGLVYETTNKLQLARERIAKLEDELQTSLSSNTDQGTIAIENSKLKTKVEELQKELASLSDDHLENTHLQELEDIQRTCDKLVNEKQKFEKQAKVRKHRLHSVARDLAKSAQLVKNYQEQCSTLEQDLKEAQDESKDLRKELASTKAQLNVKQVELQSSVKQQALAQLDTFSELQLKYDQLVQELELVRGQLTAQTHKLNDEEGKLGDMEKEISSKQAILVEENKNLRAQLSEMQVKLEQVQKERQDHLSIIGTLRTEVDKVPEMTVKASHLLDVNRQLQEEMELLTKYVTSQEEPKTVSKSMEQKNVVRDIWSELPVCDISDITLRREEAQKHIRDVLARLQASIAKSHALEEKLKTETALSNDIKQQMSLIQSDLEIAESELFLKVKETETLKAKVDTLEEQLTKKNEECFKEMETCESLKKALDEQEQNAASQLLSQKMQFEAHKAKLDTAENDTIPHLHSKLAKTISDLNHLTSDNTSRVAQIQKLESQLRTSEETVKKLTTKLTSSEKEHTERQQKCISLQRELSRKEGEFQQLTCAHTTALASFQNLEGEVKGLREKLQQSDREKKVPNDSINALHQREQQLRRSQELVTSQVRELEQLRRRVEELTNHCEGLTTTKDNLLRRLDRMEKMEMDYERLTQSLKGDKSKKGVKKLQEDNEELHIQVSTLSQWNDRNTKQIQKLEEEIETSKKQNSKLLSDLKERERCVQENKLLKQELKEVEVEVNRLKRQTYTEQQEELALKLQTQTKLIEMFNEHNKQLRQQVTELQQTIKSLGGQLEKDKPVSPPPMPIPTINVGGNSITDATRLEELERDNSRLKQKISKLERELFNAHDVSPKIRRRSSTLLVASSINWTPSNDDAFVSVPEEMLLPCSLLADAFINNMDLDSQTMEGYKQSIREGWFSCIGQKSVSAACVKSYTTTFMRLSDKLLQIIINLQDIRGNTALHHLLANANLSAVGVLLRYKFCDTNLTNRAGYTPLMMMAAHKTSCDQHKTIVERLLKRTNIDVRSKVDNLTALMLAASSDNVELIPMLLAAGANINAQDKDGSTALMFACENSNVEAVGLFLDNSDCNALLKDNDGRAALDVATSYSNPDICSMLKRKLKMK